MANTKKIYSILTILFISFHLIAQDLPHNFTENEIKQLPEINNSIGSKGFTTPPLSPVRNAAEWEELQAITITWTSYTSILKEIVRAAQSECKVIIVCSDSSSVKNYLTSNGVPLTNLIYKIASFNTVWCRDYGANCVYTNIIDSLLFIDWVYNRPRPEDDIIPEQIANLLNVPLYQTTTAPYRLVSTGGNFMSDGFGTAFSSLLVQEDNPGLTLAQIDTITKKFLGIDRYIKMTVLPYDVIHHIDMHMKLLDEETLLVGQYPTGISDGPQIEANLQYILSNFNSVYNTPYKVVRIPMPPSPSGNYPPNSSYYTYTNGVFINKTYIVPTYYQQYDTTALRILRENLPGYTIVGINCNSIIGASGAIHCITHEIATKTPLLISHQKLINTTNNTTPYTVNAKIMQISGIQNAEIYYRTSSIQPFESVSMSLTDPINNIWTGYIPAQAVGTTIDYYIHTQSVSGKQQVKPITAPTGYFTFKILQPVSTFQKTPTEKLEFKPIYPNPSNGITCIPIISGENLIAKITLNDIFGKIIAFIYEGELKQGDNNYFINTTEIPAGVYIVRIKTNTNIYNQKLIIK
jgi:agmatine deiminase